MLVNEYQLIGIQSENESLFLRLDPCAPGGYILPFEYQQESGKTFTQEKFESTFLEELYMLYYAMTLGFESEKFSITSQGDYVNLLLPGTLWIDQFRQWYQKQDKYLASPGVVSNETGIVANIVALECGAFDYNAEYWSMRVWLDKNEEGYYDFDVKSIQEVHWCVVITQAYRNKQSLVLEVNKERRDILGIENMRMI